MIYFDRQMQRIQEAFEQLDTDVSLFLFLPYDKFYWQEISRQLHLQLLNTS